MPAPVTNSTWPRACASSRRSGIGAQFAPKETRRVVASMLTAGAIIQNIKRTEKKGMLAGNLSPCFSGRAAGSHQCRAGTVVCRKLAIDRVLDGAPKRFGVEKQLSTIRILGFDGIEVRRLNESEAYVFE